MDPITQGALGAVVAQAVLFRKLPRTAWLVGLLAGLAPDLDVFLPSGGDPAAFWINHRGFTHALAFIPIGAALCTAVLMVVPAWRREWRWVFAASIIGYATHAPLDALTSYGTMLFWPFSNYRVALDWMPIVDLFFTPVLLIGLIAAAITKKGWPAQAALGLTMIYVGFGIWHNHRALDAQRELADARGHTIVKQRALPSPGTLFLWRAVYEDNEGRLNVDGVRTPFFSRAKVQAGTSFLGATFEDVELAEGADAEKARYGFDVFAWFASGYVTQVPDEINTFTDARYSLSIERMEPMWGVSIDPETGTYQRYRPGSSREPGRIKALWKLTWQGSPAYIPLQEAVSAVRNSTGPDSPL